MIWNILLVSFVLYVPLAPTAEEAAVETARSSFDAGKYAEAVKTLTAALDRAPQDAAINHWLGRCYYEQHRYDESITHAEAAVKLSPQNGEYERWLGRIYGAKAEQSHSFFLARKVKQAFETAVRLAPRSIPARRDLMQYLAEAPWIVGGSKDKAKEQVEAIAQLDPLEGHLARAAFWAQDKKWKEAQAEYLAVIAEHPMRIEPYMEAAEYFADRKDVANLDRVVNEAQRLGSRDPRVDFYRGVVLILRRTDLSTAQQLLNGYIANVPERSDYPSHREAMQWLSQK
jgi:tetratricopeptide (TPR) repeat protein